MGTNLLQKDITLILILAGLGGALSLMVNYATTAISALSGPSLPAAQILAGLHTFPLIIAELLIKKRGAALVTGGLKGLVEVAFFSRLGIVSIFISLLEGAVASLVFVFLNRTSKIAVYLAGGFSSASNFLLIHFLFLQSLPAIVLLITYLTAFVSGIFFSGYLSIQVMKVVPANFLRLRN